jgi:23S rRNA pseudouridine955/2504/2580 synthase
LKQYGLKRLFLHAYRLEFTHPGTGQPMDVIAPLDSELSAVLDALEAGR